ncbi:MAG: cache domain-containing protein, partial [Cytophagales bacterium]|nr:cache domain-containing protein [Cytophagales bacterium]
MLSVYFLSGCAMLFFSIYFYYDFKQVEIRDFEVRKKVHAEETVRRVSDVAFEGLKNSYEHMHTEEFIKEQLGTFAVNAMEHVFKQLSDVNKRIAGRRSEKKAMQAAIEEIRKFRFGYKDDFVFCITANDEPRLVVHPVITGDEGKKVNELSLPEDSRQIGRIFTELGRRAREEKSGYYFYEYKNPKSGESEGRVIYFRNYEKWNWVVAVRLSLRVFEKTIKNQLLSQVKNMRFDGGHGYFWITDSQIPPKVVFDYRSPEMIGKSAAGYGLKGSDGKDLFEAFVYEALSGKGYVYYKYEKEGTGEAVNKLSCSRYFKPYDWVITTAIYLDEYEKDAKLFEERVSDRMGRLSLQLCLFLFALLLVSALFFSRFAETLVGAIRKVNKGLLNLAKGDLSFEFDEMKASREVKEMLHSASLLKERMKEYSSFSEKVGLRDWSQELKVDDDKDQLGKSLLKMRDEIKAVARKEQDRNWHTEGIALFSEILRAQSDDEQVLDEFLSKLVHYIGANQGALFLLESPEVGNPYLELKASYAYGRKKYQTRKVEIGEGLVGQVYLEKESLRLKEVPD